MVNVIKSNISDSPQESSRIKEINNALKSLQQYIDEKTSSSIETAGMPAGVIVYFPSVTSAPSGYLKANGAAVAIASYSTLAASIYVGDSLNATALSGYKCTNPASPSTTRNTSGSYIVLPDLRGEAIRGYDDSRGIDPGRVINSFQDHQIQDHGHTTTAKNHTYSSVMEDLGTPTGAGNQLDVLASVGNPNSGNHGTETRMRNIALLACIKY